MRAFFVIGRKNSCLGFPKKNRQSGSTVRWISFISRHPTFYSLPLSLHDSTDKSLSRKDE